MLFEKIIKIRHTLAFRLTLWYAAIFSITTFLALVSTNYVILSIINESTEQDLRNQVDEFALILSLQGITSLKEAALLEAQASGERKIFVRLLYPTGVAFSSSNMNYWRQIGIDRQAVEALTQGESYILQTVSIPNQDTTVKVVYSQIGRGIILQIGQVMETRKRIVSAFKKVFLITTSSLILAAVITGWFLSKRALSGVKMVTSTAQEISEENLERRVPTQNREDEVNQLASTFNDMLDRIQKLVIGTKEMSDNIAHDLRSPITRIRGIAEITLSDSKSVAEFQKMAGDIIEECDRLLDMINTMLIISEAESGAGKIGFEIIDLGEVIGIACEIYQTLADDKGVILSCDATDSYPIRGDIKLIQRMLGNLIDNAIKYTPSNGKVDVTVHVNQSTGKIEIKISDNGIGIDKSDLPKIFDRFYRADSSRSQSGSGLGLSLSQAIAKLHGGIIYVNSTLGKGSTFKVSLYRSS